MTPTPLTPAQHAVLAKAIHTSGGKIVWFPDHIKGGARKKVLDGLFNRALITTNGVDWFVAAEGYDALGMKRPTPTVAPETVAASQTADPEIEADVRACEATWAQEPQSQDRQPRAREHSKLARILELLHSPAGASIGQMRLVTGWQAHSVRGMLANLKKKNDMAITSAKENGERVYRITEGA
jgi:hypothetical protein